MPGTDKSVTLLTGMIIAALYVVMLVGFTRESYMRRDAAMLADASGEWPVLYDVSKRACRLAQPMCSPLLKDAKEQSRMQQSCSAPADSFSRLASEPAVPLTLEALRRVMRAGP